MPYMQRYRLDVSVLHTVAYYCGFSLHPFPSLFSTASRPFPSLFLVESLGKNKASHRVCWFNLPPVTPGVLILSSPTYSGSEIREEEQGVIETETKKVEECAAVLCMKLLDSFHETLGLFQLCLWRPRDRCLRRCFNNCKRETTGYF